MLFCVQCTRIKNNAIPENSFLNLDTIIIADLIHREDIKKLQKGIRQLLKKRRTTRFLYGHNDGLDEICSRIENMDSTLLSWYEKVECGIFEFSSGIWCAFDRTKKERVRRVDKL